MLDYENTVYITATSRRLGTRGHIYLNKFPLAERQTKKDKFEFPRTVDEVQGGKKKVHRIVEARNIDSRV